MEKSPRRGSNLYVLANYSPQWSSDILLNTTDLQILQHNQFVSTTSFKPKEIFRLVDTMFGLRSSNGQRRNLPGAPAHDAWCYPPVAPNYSDYAHNLVCLQAPE